MSEGGLHAADDEILCQKNDFMLQMMKYGPEEGLHVADHDIWCQKDYMLQIMKYGVRRRITCCR